MPSYRFCRPDDIPLLVRAVNECYDIHFPEAPLLSAGEYRTLMKEIDVWPSSSMVALAGDDPIAVVIGTRRDHAVLILKIGVRPDHLRQGHGAHLLTSLSQKLAVLGPPRLLAELPLDLPGIGDFFSALTYRPEVSYVDWKRSAGAFAPVPEDLVTPIAVEEVAAQGLLEVSADAAWEKERSTLLSTQENLSGLAVTTPECVEAYLLYRERAAALDVLAAGCRRSDQEELLLGLLLKSLANRVDCEIRLPKLTEEELPAAFLEELGFVPDRRYVRYAAEASPA